MNDNFRRIQELSNYFKQRGSTTWIIKSLIYNPKIIFVCRNKNLVHLFESQYKTYMKDIYHNIFKKLWWKITKRPEPIFKSLEDNYYGLNDWPIIFDNSCFG